MPLLTAHPGMTHRPQQPMGQKGQAVMQYLDDVMAGRIAEQGLRRYGDSIRASMRGDHDAFGGLLGDLMGGGFAAKGLLGLSGMIGKTVYHGSPHKWDVPDISKVGTGEGAQAYGHGFYSAENPAVGASYRDALSPDAQMIAAPDVDLARDDVYHAVQAAIASKPGVKGKFAAEGGAPQITDTLMTGWQGGEDIDHFASFVRKADWDADVKDAYLAGIDEIKKYKPTGGHLYKLDIPDEDIPKYLDWDKPLSEQPELRSIYPGAYDELVKAQAKLPDEAKNHPQVKTLYNTGALIKKLEEAAGPDAARQLLMQEGIPGIRYLDASSRGAGEGTSNFVTFDPSRIKVLERN